MQVLNLMLLPIPSTNKINYLDGLKNQTKKTQTAPPPPQTSHNQKNPHTKKLQQKQNQKTK